MGKTNYVPPGRVVSTGTSDPIQQALIERNEIIATLRHAISFCTCEHAIIGDSAHEKEPL
jgi:hypothetical protein